MNVSDLIATKPLQAVIQLENTGEWQEVSSSFVWTEEISAHMEDFTVRLSKGEGGGIFLKGHYGTGKSHLLAWLAQQAESWQPLAAKCSSTPLKGHLPVAISLIHWDASNSLETICHSRIAECLGKESLHHGSNRHSTMTSLVGQLQQQGLQGFVLLLDELSEFLRSKQTPAALSEDIRYLQFLAESGREFSSWVIGAIQEDVEGIGSASRETSLKLKDRFPLRWDLGARHVEQMISERLLVRKEGARDHLEQLFFTLQHRWPDAFTDLSTFINIYPLHPSTLELLLGMGQLFSEHRGALRFMQQVLNGSWNPDTTPFLDNDSTSLITADILFDYFATRFTETPRLRDYYDKAYTHVVARISELIDDSDAALARSATKCIVLCTLDPRKEGVTLSELCCLLHFDIEGRADFSMAYLKEKVLDPLLNRVNYLTEKDDRYHIDLHQESYELLGKIVEERVLNITLDQLSTWNILMPLMDRRPLDLTQLWHNPTGMGTIQWVNSSRRISIGWGETDGDADVYILLPGEQLSAPRSNRLYWVPRSPSKEERVLLLTATALLRIAGETAQTSIEQQARGEALRRHTTEHASWRMLLEMLYREGRWYMGDTPLAVGINWMHATSIEALLEDPLYELFTIRHPLFHSIAPRISFYNDRVLCHVIDTFVRPGEVSESVLKQNQCLEPVQGIAQRLGLVQKVRGKLRFNWEPQQSPLVRLFDETLRNHEGELAPVRERLTHGEYGLTDQLFSFMVWSAISAGYYSAWRKGEFLPEGKLSFHNVDSIDCLKPEQTLTPEQFELLLDNSFFNDADQSYSGLSLQRQLSHYINSRMTTVARQLTALDAQPLTRLWSFATSRFGQSHSIIRPFIDFCSSSPPPSYDTLLFFLEHTDELSELHKSITWLDGLHRIYSRESSRMDTIWIFITDEYLGDLPRSGGRWIELREDLRNLLTEAKGWQEQEEPWSSMEPWANQCEQWILSYRQEYTEDHHQYYQQHTSEQEYSFQHLLLDKGVSLPKAVHNTMCTRDLEVELSAKPYCRCAFTPGHLAERADLQEVYSPLFDYLQQHTYPPEDQSRLKTCIAQRDWQGAITILQTSQPQRDRPSVRSLSVSSLKKRWQGKKWSKKDILRDFESLLDGTPDSLFELTE